MEDEREKLKRQNRESQSTEAGHAVADCLVVAMKLRNGSGVTGRLSGLGRRPTAGQEESMSKPRPFAISEVVVLEAYSRVKANKGATGVDGETIEEFERDLKGNLYKLWNRMSSGS